MLWGDRNSGGWDEGVEPITIPTEEAEVGWGVLMVQIYIGSLHKFFGSNFSWQLNSLGRLDSGLCVGSKTLFMWRYNLFQLLQIAKIVGPFKDAGALT